MANSISVKMVGIPVKDQDRSLDFYTKKLGFKVLTDSPFGEQRWIELKAPGSDVSVALFTAPGQEVMIGKFSNITFSSQNVTKTYQDLCEKGVAFTQPPKKEDWGTMAIFKDPDGNTFCLSGN